LSIISDIQHLVSWVPVLKFRKIDREQNNMAHELARFSRVNGSGGVLHSSAPTCVLELAMKDCNQNYAFD
jgi:hypothetical protein